MSALSDENLDQRNTKDDPSCVQGFGLKFFIMIF